MGWRITVLILFAAALAAVPACHSRETTSAIIHNENGEYDKAIEQARLGIQKNPEDAEAYFQLGFAYSLTGRMAPAYKSFRKSIELGSEKSELAESNIRSNWSRHFNAGIVCYQNDDFEKASEEFSEATMADPRQAKGWMNLGKTYYTLAKADPQWMEQAAGSADTLLVKIGVYHEEYWRALEVAGRIYILIGETERALETFESLIGITPDKVEVVEEAGRRFFDEQQWREAVRFFRLAEFGRHRAGNGSFELFYSLGICHFRLDEYEAAASAFKDAMTLDPENRDAHYYLLLAQYSGESWDEAIMHGQAYTEKYPDDPKGWQILSLAFSRKGMKIKAEEAAGKYQELSGG